MEDEETTLVSGNENDRQVSAVCSLLQDSKSLAHLFRKARVIFLQLHYLIEQMAVFGTQKYPSIVYVTS